MKGLEPAPDVSVVPAGNYKPVHPVAAGERRRIAALAKQLPEMVFTLSYHLDLDWLLEAYRLTGKDGAVGIDAMTAAEYPGGLASSGAFPTHPFWR